MFIKNHRFYSSQNDNCLVALLLSKISVLFLFFLFYFIFAVLDNLFLLSWISTIIFHFEQEFLMSSPEEAKHTNNRCNKMQ